jgi:DNA-binding transcriptional ArsR family regulator
VTRPSHHSLPTLLACLRAAGEETRLRILALLAEGELSVSDLTEILGQSQPRISRHLKLLTEEGLIERYQEGAWAYFRLRQDGEPAIVVRQLLGAASPSDAVLQRDSERLATVKRVRAERAQDYFSRNASAWDELRRLHVSDEAVEGALLKLVGTTPIDSLLDLGTGTGRILQLLSGIYRRAIGVDASRDMLSVARANLDKAGLSRVELRQGDIYALPFARGSFDLVIVHQVLHFLDDPARALPRGGGAALARRPFDPGRFRAA